MTFSAIDIVFAALIVIFTVRCAVKGFVSELLSMAALVLGLLASLFFFRRGGELVRIKFMPDLKIIPEIIAFAALFLLVFVAIKIIERLLKDIIEGVMLGGVDRFLGFIFGIVEGVVVVCLVLFLFSVQPLFDPAAMLEKSVFAKLLMPFITGSGKTAAPPAAELIVLLRLTARSVAGV